MPFIFITLVCHLPTQNDYTVQKELQTYTQVTRHFIATINTLIKTLNLFWFTYFKKNFYCINHNCMTDCRKSFNNWTQPYKMGGTFYD